MESEKARPRGRAGLLIGAFLALGLALAAAVLLLAWRPPLRKTSLADGSVVTLEAVTYGLQTRVQGSALQRLFYALLPAGRKEHAGVTVCRGSAPGVLAFWVMRDGPALTPTQLVGTVFDELGNESPSVYAQGLGQNRERFEFTVFPRRGRISALRLYRHLSSDVRQNSETWKALGEVPTRNPVGGTYRQWSAGPLPAAARTGDVAVAVKAFVIGADPGRTYMMRGPAEVYCSVTLRVTQGGKPAGYWSPSLESISDITGNLWNVGSGAYTSHGSEVRILFPSCTWPGEEAWKLRVRLVRTPGAAFAPHELWQVRSIPIPPRGRSALISKAATVNGASLELVGVLGPDTRPPPGFEFAGRPQAPALLLRAREPMPRDLYRSLVRARDERGREVSVSSTASTGDRSESREVLRIDAPPGAKTLDLTYGVQRARYVEILVPKKAGQP
jgi:hypothetical protein